MPKLEITYRKIDEIKPYENNPRVNEGAVGKVAASIEEFGFKNPIIIDGNNTIIAGHTRYKAAISLELEKVPTIKVENLTKEQARAFRIADNRTTDSAFWDDELLNEIILELKTEMNYDLTDFGFEAIEEEDIFEEEYDDAEEAEEKPHEVIIICMNDDEIESAKEMFGFEKEGQKLHLKETVAYKEGMEI